VVVAADPAMMLRLIDAEGKYVVNSDSDSCGGLQQPMQSPHSRSIQAGCLRGSLGPVRSFHAPRPKRRYHHGVGSPTLLRAKLPT